MGSAPFASSQHGPGAAVAVGEPGANRDLAVEVVAQHCWSYRRRFRPIPVWPLCVLPGTGSAHRDMARQIAGDPEHLVEDSIFTRAALTSRTSRMHHRPPFYSSYGAVGSAAHLYVLIACGDLLILAI